MAALAGLGYSASAGGPASAVQYEYPERKVTICHHARPKAGKKAKKAPNRRAHNRAAHVRKWHKR
jgi:hypothetical protein